MISETSITITEGEEEGIIKQDDDDDENTSHNEISSSSRAAAAITAAAAVDHATSAEQVQADLARAELLLAEEEEKYDLIFGDNYDEDKDETIPHDRDDTIEDSDSKRTGQLPRSGLTNTLNTSSSNNNMVREGDEQQLGSNIETVTSKDDFINDGLQRWQDARDVWCGNSSGNSQSSTSASLPRSAINIDVDKIIDILFDPRWRGGGIVPTVPPAAAAASIATTRTDSGTLSPSSSDFGESSGALPPILSPQQQLHQDHLPPRFPSNVPLPQMIDVLVDLWEAEGLDI